MRLRKVFGICGGKTTKMGGLHLHAFSLVVQMYSIRRKFNDFSKHHKINPKLIVTTSPLLSFIHVFIIGFHLKKNIHKGNF